MCKIVITYEDLIIFRNELKNKKIYKYKLIGIVSALLLSKDVFKHNADIGEFLINVFGIEFKEYVMRSRTMVVARISKELFFIEDTKDCISRLTDFIIDKAKDMSNEETKKNALDGWI